MGHKLAAGVVVLKDGKLLLVKDKSGWSLPKGSTEIGETFLKAAEREGYEETGFKIAVEEVAFVTEFTSEKYGQHLQVYYSGELISNFAETEDPDQDISEVKFVEIKNLRNMIKFRPWILPLECWIKDRKLNYHSFDLDFEGFEIKD
ncbi:NUDIX hydrolase [Paenibacillus sp. GP183]|jgi:ADP-ribose pyrophosphatase YjhB (NUDIX family)|uniref:NUDIX domain-containing protein n=1 Tax=Paenibacillus sp. GP183 TaxID=1882751 RepID=UPI00089BAA01|nr:NUDIX hydrolase [Paenibacillus sp. GP183]SEC76324.1 ADP-ribose pyrophosphatase YjhB, NUDIX family [Paenibacillus sp. GP183]